MSIEFTYTQEEVDALCKESYEKGRADATEELPTSLYCDGFNDGYAKGRADALNIDMEKPMHFTDEQKAWVKNYIIINAKRQRADAIDECKALFRKYILTKEIEGLDELFEQLKEQNK